MDGPSRTAECREPVSERPRGGLHGRFRARDGCDREESATPPALGVRGWALAGLFYLVLTVIGTHPAPWTLSSRLPTFSVDDPAQHLWVMQWYRRCLVEGRLPFLSPDIQSPVGAPLGHFSPLQLQGLLSLPLSLVTENDILIYNVLWLGGFWLTGLGTFALGYRLTGSGLGAGLAGVLAMLSAPMTLHACGHLELIYVGTFPLFLLAWMAMVDHPSAGRVAWAVVGYVAVAMSAAYFAVFAVFPAVLYLVWEALRAWRRGEAGWLRARLGAVSGFAMAAGVLSALAFSCQMWAVWQGDPLSRSRAEFDRYGAPLWGYAVPTWTHRLHSVLPISIDADIFGENWTATAGERASYLGLVTLLLLGLGAWRRVRFAKSGYLWAALGLMVLLSLGSSVSLAGYSVSMPSGWLRSTFPPFAMIRVPARFNLFAAVLAAVVAGAALGELLQRIPVAGWRGVVFAVVVVLAVLDLQTPFTPTLLPKAPAGYAAIMARDPHARFLEVPQDPSIGTTRNALYGYWQASHGGRTSGGYSGHGNRALDARLTYNAPFLSSRLDDPGFLTDPEHQPIDLLGTTQFLDYVWLYLHANEFRYAVVHRDTGLVPNGEWLERVHGLMKRSLVQEDARTRIYAHDRMALPEAPTIVLTEGWGRRYPWRERTAAGVGRDASAALYQPDATGEVVFAMEAAALRESRVVIVRANGREVGRWAVAAEEPALYLTPPFRLPAGVSRLELSSDGAVVPEPGEAPAEGDRAPLSLRVSGVCFRPAQADDPRPGRGAGLTMGPR